MGYCGRADITAEAGDYLYVFELKVTDNSKDIATKLTEAKEQIIKNKYARRLTDKTVIPVALVLENNSKSREKTDTPVCEIVALEKSRGYLVRNSYTAKINVEIIKNSISVWKDPLCDPTFSVLNQKVDSKT